MKKIFLVISIVTMMSFTGCSTIKVIAPEGKNVSIVPGTKGKVVKEKNKRVLYAFWGLMPLTDNTTSDMMYEVKDNSKVSVDTYMDLLDVVFSTVTTGLSLTSRSVVVKEIE